MVSPVRVPHMIEVEAYIRHTSSQKIPIDDFITSIKRHETIYKLDTEWWPDLVTEVLELLLTPDFLKQCLCDYHVIWLQYTDQIQS